MPITSKQQINVSLPKPTVRHLDRLVKPAERGRLIDRALRAFFRVRRDRDFASLLRDGARERAKRDQQIAREWSTLTD